MTWKEIIFIWKPTLHCSPLCTFPTYRLLLCSSLSLAHSPPPACHCRTHHWLSVEVSLKLRGGCFICRKVLLNYSGVPRIRPGSVWHELRLMWHIDRGEAGEEREVGRRGKGEWGTSPTWLSRLWKFIKTFLPSPGNRLCCCCCCCCVVCPTRWHLQPFFMRHKPFCAFDSPLTFCQLSLFIRNVFA